MRLNGLIGHFKCLQRSYHVCCVLSLGGQLGTIVALLTAPVIIDHLGWPAVFEIYGGLGLLWMLAWQPLVANYPPLQQQQQMSLSTHHKASHATEQRRQPQQQQQWQQEAAGTRGGDSAEDLPGGGAGGADAERLASSSSASSSGSSFSPPGKLQRLQDVPWKSFFTNKAFIALILAHGSSGKNGRDRGVGREGVTKREWLCGEEAVM